MKFLDLPPWPLRAALLAGLGSPVICSAELIGYDGFDYRGTTMNGREGGTFWGYQNISPAGHKAGMSDWDDAPGFGNTSLSSGGLLYTGDSGVVREYGGPTGPDETNGAINGVNVAKKVYYRVTVTRGTGATWCGVSSFDFGTERLFFGLFPDGSGKFSIYNQDTFTPLAVSTVNATVGQTYTLVAKLDFTAGTVSLYADPNLGVSEASNTPIATAAYTGTNWSTAVRLGSGGAGLVTWDDLAVATTWESLRTYEVTHLGDSGAGSLRVMASLARTTGGRVTFAPSLRSTHAITGTGRLLRFKRETPGTLELDVPVTGLQPGEALEAIDFRPATGELYGLGRIPTLEGDPSPMPQVRLYRLNPATGAATQVGAGPFSTTLGNSGGMGFDFDPRVDRIRVTNEQGDNVLLHPDTGVITAVQTPLAFSNGATDALGGEVRALQTAYSRNFPGTASTTLYGFHNYTGGFIRIGGDGPLADPGNGQVELLVGATQGPGTTTGFDIGDDGTALVSGGAAGSNGLDFKSTLYQLEPESGAMTALGLIGNGIARVAGIAAGPSRITLTTGPIVLSGGNAFVVDGPATAPGITLAPGSATAIVDSGDAGAVGFRHLTFTGGRGSQGGALSYSAPVGPEVTGLLSLDRCTFKDNHASNRGGALAIVAGNVRMTRCTLAGNTSGTGGASVIHQQHGGSFGAETWGKILIDHCTITGNRTASSTAGNPPQALVLPSAKVTVSSSIIAGNNNGGALPADIRFTGDISQPAVVERSLIGDATGTGVTDGANGNRAGSTAAPLPARLVPLGDHGGPNATCPPFPGSPAIGLAAGSGAASDQRGFLVSGAPDAGAADFRGRPDLLPWWETDWDRDGVPFGLECLLGRDPLVPTPGAPLELRPAPSGTRTLYFGPTLPPSAGMAYGRLRLTRSYHLLGFADEVGAVSPATPGNPATLLQRTSATGYTWAGDGSASLRFIPPAGQPRVFFRLEAQLLP